MLVRVGLMQMRAANRVIARVVSVCVCVMVANCKWWFNCNCSLQYVELVVLDFLFNC